MMRPPKSINRIFFPVLFATMAILSGCATFQVGEEIADINIKDLHPTSSICNKMIPREALGSPKLDAAITSFETNKKDRTSVKIAGDNIFPQWLLENKTAYKIARQQKQALLRDAAGGSNEEYSASELLGFVKSSMTNSGLFSKEIYKSSLLSSMLDEEKGTNIYNKRLFYYMSAYIAGEYVDRSGVKYASPVLSSSIGNDTIIPFVMVTFDAYLDTISDVLVFYNEKKDGKFVNPIVGKNIPTYSSFEEKYSSTNSSRVVKEFCYGDINTPEYKKCLESWCEPEGYRDITKGEALSINVLSSIASEQSKHLSALIVRAFNDFEVGAIVIGGDISIGDNDTFSKIIEAVIARLSHNKIEVLLQAQLSAEGESKKLKQIIEIIGDIYNSIEDDKGDEDKKD